MSAVLVALLLQGCDQPAPLQGSNTLVLVSDGPCHQAIFVIVNSDSTLELRGEAVALGDLARTLQEDLKHDKSCAVWIVSRQDAPLSSVQDVLAVLKEAGFSKAAHMPISEEAE